jgi:SAM-dependent methyltransferase
MHPNTRNNMKKPTERFTDRVENYVKYRPSYPPGVIETLKTQCGLSPKTIVADIGSGTGILTSMVLQTGCAVFGIEPNDAMRRAAEHALKGYQNFTSIASPAESTGLPDSSVDLITVAQAFHWLDRGRAKKEFMRILKPGGWVTLVWNKRRTEGAFLEDYEALLLQYAPEYKTVNMGNIREDDLQSFFHPNTYTTARFDNSQRFDFEGLKGRVESSSYCPAQNQNGYHSLMMSLKGLFRAHEEDGSITFNYDTFVYFGQLK